MSLMKFNRNKNLSATEVRKKSIYSFKDRLSFGLLVVLYLTFLTLYTKWWFSPTHIPANWSGLAHNFDILIFILLTFVVFIGTSQRLAGLFALWFASKPIHQAPSEGLKVAFLTCFVPGSEPVDMLVKTLKAMKDVRYPHDTWILDEGDSDEVKVICQELGVKYFTRKGIEKYNQLSGKFRTKTKAGNHNAWADKHDQDYDIVAQIDMDMVPEPDYFEKTLGYFNDPKVGFIGMPQYYKNQDNWISRGSAEQANFFHGPMQQGFYGCDMPFLIGTSHVYRTLAMKKIGGYAPTIVEDHLTGMKFYEYGYKGVYVPEILVKGEGPLNWGDYFNQQMRWSYGLYEILFKHTPKIFWKLSFKKRINYFLAQLYYFTGVAVVVGMALTFIYLVFGVRSANMGLWQWLLLSAPLLILSTVIQVYTHKFSLDPENEPIFGWLGMLLNLGANLIYTVAFVNFLTGKKLTYMVTQKGSSAKSQRVPLQTFKLHLICVTLMTVALISSFIYNHSAIQLRFWALFNIVTLSMVSFSIYWDSIVTRLRFLRLDLKLARYSYGFTLVALLTLGAYFSLSQQLNTASAYLNPQQLIAPIVEQKVAGKILPPEKGAFLGVSLYQHNDTDYLNSLQQKTQKNFAIVGYYQAWGVEKNQFNKEWADNISKNGSVPMITWEPWTPVSGFDRSASKVNQKEYRLENITAGNFDDYIRSYAKDVKAYRKPVMIRFAHEMNGNWYPWGSTFNKPADYVSAWRHVHEIFDSEGATNVTWIWSPNEAYVESRVPNADKIDLFYPGDDYVDYVGLSAFNWAGTYKQNVWRSPQNLFDYTISKLKKFNKPIIITETASAEVKGNPSMKAKWITQLALYIETKPEVKGIIWFNTEDNGVDWTLTSSTKSTQSFSDSFSTYFATKGK
jgi:cellulose synthase (UDP-forming)